MINWGYFRQSLARHGAMQVLRRYAYRAVKRVVDFDVWRVYYLPARAASVEEVLHGQYTCGQLDEETLVRAASDARTSLQPDEVRACLARGELCFGVWADRQLLSYLWVAPSGAHIGQSVCIHFEQPHAFSRWAFTVESHRGQHLHAQLKACAVRSLARAGKQGMISTVDVGNLDSLAAAEHAGCQRAGTIVVLGLLGRRLKWASAGCGRFGIALT